MHFEACGMLPSNLVHFSEWLDCTTGGRSQVLSLRYFSTDYQIVTESTCVKVSGSQLLLGTCRIADAGQKLWFAMLEYHVITLLVGVSHGVDPTCVEHPGQAWLQQNLM